MENILGMAHYTGKLYSVKTTAAMTGREVYESAPIMCFMWKIYEKSIRWILAYPHSKALLFQAHR